MHRFESFLLRSSRFVLSALSFGDSYMTSGDSLSLWFAHTRGDLIPSVLHWSHWITACPLLEMLSALSLAPV